ncbi:MSMEG_0569 family flavin-dependent oxidoreductase [Reichenbachiella versicolor]|uniref:MSMEG_0569 family flavin-dependent oxidoreductase n=1 Tax=Reichenbachiella versicolor TaxID=1821036 RepID=UPI000D6DF757|nr:MSMEG_0569 family flavin-dependent oxidoreductase [Reichenbachiella versicolor]
MKKHYPVIIVGGGQAGLAISYCLKEKDIDHIIFDKGQVGDSWRLHRWDNFTLVTPNWQCELPGYKYSGDNPKGFMNRDQTYEFVKGYADMFNPPLENGVTVTSVDKVGDIYEVQTSMGDFTSQEVVIASGAFHNPLIPPVAHKLPNTVKNVHSSEYKNASQLPEGGVMIVGSGQSGCQIAEDLHLEGRKVHLCVGNAPKSPRNYRGRDVVEWLDQMGYYEKSIDTFPDPVAVRRKINHYVTGRDGGREIDLRAFALEGMKLYGLFNDVKDGEIHFGNNLKEDLDKADAAAQSIKDRIDEFIATNKIEAPIEEPYVAPWEPESDISSIDIAESGITSVIWCIGFTPNFKWLKLDAFDQTGYPRGHRGVSDIEGLYFLGFPWMHTWGSGRFSGITQDAWYLSEQIAERLLIEQ